MTYIIRTTTRYGAAYVCKYGGTYTYSPADAQLYPTREEAEADRESMEEVVEEVQHHANH